MQTHIFTPNKKYTLMCGDIKVFTIDDSGEFNLYNDDLIPFQLKYRLNLDSKNSVANWFYFGDYLADRALPFDRANYREFMRVLKITPKPTREFRLKVSETCLGLSVSDNYWILPGSLSLSWQDVNVRCTYLNSTLEQVAFYGAKITLDGKPYSPELTAQGVYPKCWHRENGQPLRLYKRSHEGCNEAEVGNCA